MSLPVVLRSEAIRDTEEARDYLESQRAGLGQTFLSRLNEVLARIGAMPKGVRRRLAECASGAVAAVHLCRLLSSPRRSGRGARGDARQP